MRSNPQATSLAVFLFLSPAPAAEFGDRRRVLAALDETVAALGPAGTQTALREWAWAYGDHPEAAAERMTACLAAVAQIPGLPTVPAQRTEAHR
ncbi:hypothetical protein [Streptomyces mobaraensis]|uniref:Uncharacterized protein n=1 Tax=Streptomyces mobaraensis TaxID=35621 RepID=A0A5N5VXM2_STRMB|nr:hypothetical protein [Streptomyces mobaraensis]KAB7833549.1 hypothetical protein FRZ00_33435 [Streptomyces mobaraensis]